MTVCAERFGVSPDFVQEWIVDCGMELRPPSYLGGMERSKTIVIVCSSTYMTELSCFLHDVPSPPSSTGLHESRTWKKKTKPGACDIAGRPEKYGHSG